MLEGLLVALTPASLLYITVGVFAGIVVGALPGFTATMGTALLLPFTFDLDPYTAFAMLLGMGSVVTTSDTIPAVLFGVPGTSGSQATVLDGLPMARKGEDLVLSFQQSAKTLQDLRLQADVRIGRLVGEANDLIGRIADLNDRILRQTTVDDEVTDLLDERDRALDRLSQIMDVQIFSRGDSGVVVFTSSGDALIDKANAAVTHVSAANMGASNTHAGGDIGDALNRRPEAVLGAPSVVRDVDAADAVLDPEMAPKPAPANAVAMPSPPGTRPTQVAAALNRSLATPDRMTNSAMRMNIGTVISS